MQACLWGVPLPNTCQSHLRADLHCSVLRVVYCHVCTGSIPAKITVSEKLSISGISEC